ENRHPSSKAHLCDTHTTVPAGHTARTAAASTTTDADCRNLLHGVTRLRAPRRFIRQGAIILHDLSEVRASAYCSVVGLGTLFRSKAAASAPSRLIPAHSVSRECAACGRRAPRWRARMGSRLGTWHRDRGTVMAASTSELRSDLHSVEPIPEADRDSTGIQQ